VSIIFNEKFDNIVDSNHFGCVKNRSTTHALLTIMHHLFQYADSSINFIRIVFVDFHKAFDLIDHVKNSRARQSQTCSYLVS
jgi:hypothetical protein